MEKYGRKNRRKGETAYARPAGERWDVTYDVGRDSDQAMADAYLDWLRRNDCHVQVMDRATHEWRPW